MKKLFCYLGILLIIGLVLMPPALRIFLPDKVQEEKIVEVERYLLYCVNDEFIAINTYEGENVNLVNLKKMNQETDYEYQTGEELLELFDSIKDKGDTLYNILEDGELVTIDFSVSSHPNLDIGNLINNSTIQKEYYESQGLTCEIRK